MLCAFVACVFFALAIVKESILLAIIGVGISILSFVSVFLALIGAVQRVTEVTVEKLHAEQ
jgi:hypothetical protein